MSAWQSFLTGIENSALGEVVRAVGVWAYGVINLIHILGIATLFGSIAVLDLRLMGWRRNTSLAAISAATVPLAVVGFVAAASSGICMLATNAREYIGNPFLPIKFAAIALGLTNSIVLSRLMAWRYRATHEPTGRERQWLAALGGVSLGCWLVAIGAGRMIGYW